MEKVCAIRVIAESDIVQEFLADTDDEQVRWNFFFLTFANNIAL